MSSSINNASYILLSQHTAWADALNVVANNIANNNTTGFKRDMVINQNISVQDDLRYPMAYVVNKGTYRDDQQGAIEQTLRDLDVAIQGNNKSFFMVQTPLGIRYTRAGNFTKDNNDVLITTQGYPVLGPDAAPITFDPKDEAPSIDKKGNVYVGANLRGQIGVLEFSSELYLEKTGENLYQAVPNSPPPVPAQEFSVVQGFLEKSNLNSIVELTKMMEFTREFEYTTAGLAQLNDLERNAMHTIAKD